MLWVLTLVLAFIAGGVLGFLVAAMASASSDADLESERRRALIKRREERDRAYHEALMRLLR